MLCTFCRCGNWLREAKWMFSVSNLVVELDLRTGFVSFLSFCPFFPTSHLCSNYYPHSGYLGFPGGFWILSFKAACPFPASRAYFVWALGFLSSLGEYVWGYVCPDQCVCTITLTPHLPRPLLNVSHVLPFSRSWMPCKWWLHWLSLLPHPAIPVNDNSLPPGFSSHKESERISHSVMSDSLWPHRL